MTHRWALLLAGGLLLTACGSATAGSQPDDRLLVVTTVSPITSIASSVGGEAVQVRGLVPEGADSHTFEPAPSAAAVLSEADLIVVNGLQLEDPTLRLASANKPDATQIVELGTEVLAPERYIFDFSFPADAGKPNPHLWTDPVHAGEYARLIADRLADLDPENEPSYRDNLDDFLARTRGLADALAEDQASVPGGIRLVTYHDAYAYVARRFGWEVVAAVQPASFADPAPADVAALIDQVRAEDVSAVFGSEVFPSPVLTEIAGATGAAYIDDLRDDDLPGAPGDPEHSFLELLRFNYITIIEGLGGQASALRALDMTNAAADEAEYPQ